LGGFVFPILFFTIGMLLIQVFTMSKTMERITFVLTWIFQGAQLFKAPYGDWHHASHAFTHYTDYRKEPPTFSLSHDDKLIGDVGKQNHLSRY